MTAHIFVNKRARIQTLEEMTPLFLEAMSGSELPWNSHWAERWFPVIMRSKPLSLALASICIGVSHEGYGGKLQCCQVEIGRGRTGKPPALIT
jgi:hypothetical protein